MQDFSAGQWDEALDKFRRATDIFRRIGDTAAEGNAAYNEAEILVRQGRYCRGRRAAHRRAADRPGRGGRGAGGAGPAGVGPRRWPERTTSTGPSPWRGTHGSASTGWVSPRRWRDRPGPGRDPPGGRPIGRSRRGTRSPRRIRRAGRRPSTVSGVGSSAATGRPEEARELYAVALAAAEEAGDRLEQGLALAALAAASRRTPRLRGAPEPRDPWLDRCRPAER